MIGNLIIFVILSFTLLFFAGVGVLAAITFFINFHQKVRFLYTEYLSVIFGLGWISIAIAMILKAAVSLEIIPSSSIGAQVLNNSISYSVVMTSTIAAIGGLIYKFRGYLQPRARRDDDFR